MKKHTPAALTLVLSLVAATALMAQAPTADIDAVTATPALRVQESGGVQFLNGGAGNEERNAMKALQTEFPLQIVFSSRDGAYGVAQQVRVLDGGKQLVAVDNAGPMLMVKLPPGRYTVEADFAGATQRRTVHVDNAPKTVHWSSHLVSRN
ncbi:MAG: hypothetical protein AB1430_16010 [Pseudomonadota bacterium]